jgi:hypothetical protein
MSERRIGLICKQILAGFEESIPQEPEGRDSRHSPNTVKVSLFTAGPPFQPVTDLFRIVSLSARTALLDASPL